MLGLLYFGWLRSEVVTRSFPFGGCSSLPLAGMSLDELGRRSLWAWGNPATPGWGGSVTSGLVRARPGIGSGLSYFSEFSTSYFYTISNITKD